MSDNPDQEYATDESTDDPTTNDMAIETDVSASVDSSGPTMAANTVVRAENVDVWYNDEQALKDISLEIPENQVTAMIGPSGCGKSTFLRCINRMNDLIDAASVEGDLFLRGKNVYDGDVDERVEESLKAAALWDEVNDQLDSSGLELSGGQQQRLCIARAIAPDPEVVLMDEPTSALDPVAASKIEDLIDDLAEEYTVIIVTHNMQQAARISDRTAVFLTGGELVEYDDTAKIFEDPEEQRVEDYITGKFG